MKTILIVISASILLVIGGIWLSYGMQNKNTEEAMASDNLVSKTGIHWHPELTIVIKGEKRPIPTNIGIGMQFAGSMFYDSMMMMTDMHTHDDSGVMHWEVMQGPVTKDDVRLGNFFAVWDKTFNKDCIFEYCNGPTDTVKMFVNGQENTEFENYLVRDKDKIEIRYDPTAALSAAAVGYFKKVSGDAVSVDGKPYFLYVGTKFCPFCAAERWSLVQSLSLFGTWTGLKADTSSQNGGFSELPTYDFVNASYASRYISFAHKELADKNGIPIPGQDLTDFEKNWVDQYNPRGSVPFLFINGQYVQIAAGYSPQLLEGKTFEAVKQNLDDTMYTPLSAAIREESNILAAYICKSTNNQPGDVCTKPDIAMLVGQIQ